MGKLIIKPNRAFCPGYILKKNGYIRIVRFTELPEQNQQNLYKIFDALGVNASEEI